MELSRCGLPLEWEERWRKEKERLKRMVEEGGEGAERNEQELRRIVAYNDSKMGLSNTRRNSASSGQVHEENSGDILLDCCKDNYPCHIFGILSDFWKMQVLTDLVLVLENGQSYSVHAAVLAAVSLFVRDRLHNKKEAASCWTLQLSSEVDSDGLRAVLEFAYTGSILCLTEENVESVKAAAKVMEYKDF
ncbi:hypothetical protein WMY93_015077 [Mugilogobius chulae]|uniref:BTB domain-containing protein n=1 Tax=Mugilogobius chulae TaxID=88201 RepID=A0AAW0P667_9GOBI